MVKIQGRHTPKKKQTEQQRDTEIQIKKIKKSQIQFSKQIQTVFFTITKTIQGNQHK